MSRDIRPNHNFLLALALAVPLAMTAFASGALAQESATPLSLTAVAVNMNSTRPAAGASRVEIKIERWSMDQERQELVDTLLDRGTDQLLTALQETPRVGYIRTPDSIALDLRYARETVEPDGSRRIVLGTDRRMTFWELSRNSRSSNYPFTVIEIRLDKNGKGDGRMSIATKVTADRERKWIELENYSNQPVMLKNVEVEK
jgi:hypothetical protein